MKKVRRFLYLAIMAVTIAVVAVFAAACGEKEKAPATQYTLKFMNGTAVYDTVTGTAGSAIEYKSDPTRANLVFDGWSLTENGEITELPEKMPAENRTYYAVFSARYRVTLNAGSCGSVPVESATLTVKSGVKLYDLISDITPTVAGNATFAAWFYNGAELTAQSTTLMPTADITLEAKYSVAYSLNEYKQLKYGVEGYGDANVVSGTGYVGEYPVISNYTGYEYNETSDNDGDKVVTVPLSANSSDNTYNVYYDLRAYNVIFNSNLSSDVTVDGKMETAHWGYDEENTVPECEFTATGYRFIGWSSSANGKVEYLAGDKLSVTRSTVLYAVWSKGYTDAIGQSSDYIFVIADETGKKEVYLRRLKLDDIKGEYNATANTFVFKNSSDQVILRGIAYPDTETYAYIDNAGQTTYYLSTRTGTVGDNGYVEPKDTVNKDVTLTVKENGDLIYDDGTTEHNGTMSFDHSSDCMMFDGGADNTFRFRLTTRNDGTNDVPAFEIRDEYAGVRYGLNQDGTLDATTYISFDGYGNATMYVIGYNSLVRSDDTLVVSTATGYYEKLTDEADRSDLRISLFRNNYVRTTYLTLIDSNRNLGTAANPVYKVFAERELAGTIYAKPESDPASWQDYMADENTAKIELDGYGLFVDSAKYTFMDGDNKQTVQGGYIIDTYLNELTIVTTDSLRYKFSLSYVTTDEAAQTTEILFEEINEGVYTSRPIIGLDNLGLNLSYRMIILDGNKAEFAFSLPVSDRFFGIYEMNLRLTTAFGGTYVEAGKDSDDNKIYEFTADESLTEDIIQYIYINYYYAYSQKALNVSGFDRFKFIYSTGYLNDGTKLACFVVNGTFDGYKDVTLKYDEVTYALDGYGVAVPADTTVGEKPYMVGSGYGMTTLLALEISPKSDTADAVYENYAEVTLSDVKSFKKVIAQYNTENASFMFRVMVLEDGYAYIGYYYSQVRHFIFYSFGTLTEANGLYTYTEISSDTTYGFPLLSIYGDISFRIEKEPTDKVAGSIILEDKLQETLTVEGVGTLTVDRSKSTATFVDADNTSYSGSYGIHEDILDIIYTIPATGEGSATNAIKSLKLVYGTGADADKVVSFKEVGSEAGTWWDYESDASTIVLSGEYDGEIEIDAVDADGNPTKKTVKTAKATWTYLNDAKEPVVVIGKYYKTDVRSEYCFIYTDSEAGEVRKLFATSYDSVSMTPLFKFRDEITVAQYVYGSVSDNQALAILIYDGYTQAQLYISASQRIYGTLTVHENEGVLSFAVANANTVFYFGYFPTSQTAGKWVLLDGTVSDPNFGTFTSADNSDFKVNGSKVTSVRFTGYGIAWLSTEGEDSDPTAVYYTTVSNMYILYTFDANDNIVVLSPISLRVRNNGENAEDYIIMFADKALYDLRVVGDKFVVANTFTDADNRVLIFDGYSSAVYIDGKGVRHNAVYVKSVNPVAGDNAVIVQVVYMGDNGYESIVVAVENGEFTEIGSDDPRYPQGSEPEPEPDPVEGTETVNNNEAQAALAA